MALLALQVFVLGHHLFCYFLYRVIIGFLTMHKNHQENSVCKITLRPLD